METSDIKLVQDSFAKVVPIKEAAAELFYGRLFEIAPKVKPLFSDSDMATQGQKLMATLAIVVKGLSDLPSMLRTAQTLAVRHNDYGVEDHHYAYVGEALIWTLAQGLGEAFTDEVKAAWVKAYTVLSGVMIEAAHSASGLGEYRVGT